VLVLPKHSVKNSYTKFHEDPTSHLGADARSLTDRQTDKAFFNFVKNACPLKHVIEGNTEGRIEVTGRRGRRRKQLLDSLKEKRGYWEFKEEALDRTVWRTRFGRGYGPVVRQTAE
jgi:hypothetical protein